MPTRAVTVAPSETTSLRVMSSDEPKNLDGRDSPAERSRATTICQLVVGTMARAAWPRMQERTAEPGSYARNPAPSDSLAQAAWIPRLTIWRGDGTMHRREGKPH